MSKPFLTSTKNIKMASPARERPPLNYSPSPIYYSGLDEMVANPTNIVDTSNYEGNSEHAAAQFECFSFQIQPYEHLQPGSIVSQLPKTMPPVSEWYSDFINRTKDKAIRGENISKEYEELKTAEPEVMKKFFCSLKGMISKENLQRVDEQCKISETENNPSILAEWASTCSSVNYFTDKSKNIIQNYIYEWQHKTYTTDIVQNLLKTDEGRAFAEKIYKEGDKLDASHKQLIHGLLWPKAKEEVKV